MKKAHQWLKQVRWVRIEVWAIVGLSFTFVLLLMGLILADSDSPSNLMLFFGRFHPIIVHLPIGMLLLAGILEVVSARFRTFRVLRYATAFVLYLGAIGAALAVFAGLLLSLEGGYDADLLRIHKWIGIAVASGAIGSACLRILLDRTNSSHVLYRLYASMLTATVVLLLFAGHLGGSLTHGPTYLTQHIPAPLKSITGLSLGADSYEIANIDSARIYEDLVWPIFDRRCIDCHGAAKSRGDLRLDTKEGVQAGGESGPVVSPGSPSDSDLLRRVTLPHGHDDVMPPDGAQLLTVGETEIIRWWIANGASYDQKVADVDEVPTAVETALVRIAGPRPIERSVYYRFDVSPFDTTAIAKLERSGFRVQKIAHDLDLLEVSYDTSYGGMSESKLEQLGQLAPNITWLDLSRSEVRDSHLNIVSEMPYLTRLYLQFTPVSDAGVSKLQGLRHLTYVNLVGTSVSDVALDYLAEIGALSSVYLWQTDVTDAGLEDFQERRPTVRTHLSADVGLSSDTTVTAFSDSL